MKAVACIDDGVEPAKGLRSPFPSQSMLRGGHSSSLGHGLLRRGALPDG